MSSSFVDADSDINSIIEEAEKIIDENRRRRASTAAIVQDIVNARQQAQRDFQNILNDLDNFLLPPSLPVDDDIINYIAQEEELLIDHELMSSTTSSNLSSGNDDVLLISDSSISHIPIVDLCTPINRRRRRRHQISSNTDDIIEIDDYQSPSKKAIIDVQPTINNNKSISPNNAPKDDSIRNLIVCPICLESTVNRRPTSTKCGHVFCTECIKSSLKISKKCPLCKRQCSEKQLISLYL